MVARWGAGLESLEWQTELWLSSGTGVEGEGGGEGGV